MSVAEIKDAINEGLDSFESAGSALAEITPPGPTSLTQRLSDLLEGLEQWKADVWTEIER